MSCPLNPLDCVGSVVGAATGSALNDFADAIRQAVVSIVKATLTWWLGQNSVDVSAAPVDKLQHLLLPLTVVIAVGSVMWQGIRMTLSRKPDPLWDVGRGLAILAAVTGVGIAAIAGSLRAGDGLSTWLLNQSTGGQFNNRLVDMLSMSAVTQPGTVILLGMLTFFVTLIQWILLFFRQGSILILAGLLPLAAAGSMTTGTKPWLRKLTAWLLSLIAYKPMVAFVYAAGFTLLGSSNDLSSTILGIVVLALSVVAMPALLRFFSWGIDNGTHHLGGAVTGSLARGVGVATAAVSIGGLGRGGGAATQAASIDKSLPAGAAGAHPAIAAVGAVTTGARKAVDATAGALTAAPGAKTGAGS